MIKTRLALSILVVLCCVVNLIVALVEGNSAAAWADATAIVGWLLISVDTYDEIKLYSE